MPDQPRAGEEAPVTTATRARYDAPKKIECHQGIHADCSGEWCTCPCHKNRRKKVEG